MKILQLCMRVPFPPSDGATIAMYNLAKSLYDNGAEVKILSFNTNKNYVPAEKIAEAFRSKTNIETVDIDLAVKPIPAFLNLFTNESYNISRFVSVEFKSKLIRILSGNQFDIVQLEGLYLTPYLETIRKHSKAKIVLRAHNVEYIIWDRLARSVSNPLKKKYLELLTKRLKKYEISLINSYDAILPITGIDGDILKSLGCTVPQKITPIGVNAEDYPFSETAGKEFSIFHLGSMDWMPNLEAVDWFLQHAYEKLVKAIPGIKIYLAGKDMPQRIKEKANDNLIVLDRIENAKSFMLDKSVMIVPLLSGGGMRVKIIEGMAAGKAIVSTAIGAEGIDYTNGKNILIADTADEFCQSIIKLNNNREYCKELRRNARELVEKQYDNAAIGKGVTGFYKSLLKETDMAGDLTGSPHI